MLGEKVFFIFMGSIFPQQNHPQKKQIQGDFVAEKNHPIFFE